MPDQRIVKLMTKAHRQRAVALVSAAPEGYVVSIREPTRSLDQNARMWAHLTDISRAEPLGRKYTREMWKSVFMSACGYEVQFLQGLDGTPFPAGFKTSSMSVKQMADFISYIEAFMAEHNIPSSEPYPY